MKHTKKVTLILVALLLPLMAEEVMKITLIDDVSAKSLSTLSKIVFEETAMIAGGSYNLDEIVKIEFYDDGGTPIIDNNSPDHSPTSSHTQGEFGFAVIASQLSLTLPEQASLSVSLFSMNGRKVAELFSGNAQAGVLNFNLTKNNLATGIYSVMVKADNVVFVRKITIQ